MLMLFRSAYLFPVSVGVQSFDCYIFDTSFHVKPVNKGYTYFGIFSTMIDFAILHTAKSVGVISYLLVKLIHSLRPSDTDMRR